MKFGDLIVIKMGTYKDSISVCGLMDFYEPSESYYGVFELSKCSAGNKTIEGSFRVKLVPLKNNCKEFPTKSYSTDIFYSTSYKIFDPINESLKAKGFCDIQNNRLKLIEDIKNNHDKCIYFTDTKGDYHEFRCDKPNVNGAAFYEMCNGEKVVDEDGILYMTQHELERILFNIDWEYNEPLKTKYNSFWKKIINYFK